MGDFLEVLAATTCLWTLCIGFIISAFVSVVLLFCPTLWWAIILYAGWIWYDRKICEQGGRPISWIRSLAWWRYAKYYFDHKFIISADINLDPKKNYLFACFPHGAYPFGPFASFVDGYQVQLKHHQPHMTALDIQFKIPFIRELFLGIGAVSANAPSIKYLLNKEKGGNIVSVLIGGADEGLLTKPGTYKVIVNKRKGFVKMALRTGAPLVPVITFGETDIFDQLDFPGSNCLQKLAKSTIGLGLIIPRATWVIVPYKVPVVTVAGKPIDVEKIENPSNEEIDLVHQKFVDGLKELFEEYKHSYVKNPENTFLEIVG